MPRNGDPALNGGIKERSGHDVACRHQTTTTPNEGGSMASTNRHHYRYSGILVAVHVVTMVGVPIIL